MRKRTFRKKPPRPPDTNGSALFYVNTSNYTWTILPASDDIMASRSAAPERGCFSSAWRFWHF